MPDWEVYYYRNKRGREPVKDFIDDLRMKDQVKIIDWISRLEELGSNAIRPLVEYLGDNIYELRVKLSDTETRILYFFIFKNCLILADAWNKKKDAASKTEYKKHIEISKKCLMDYNDRIKGKEEL